MPMAQKKIEKTTEISPNKMLLQTTIKTESINEKHILVMVFTIKSNKTVCICSRNTFVIIIIIKNNRNITFDSALVLRSVSDCILTVVLCAVLCDVAHELAYSQGQCINCYQTGATLVVCIVWLELQNEKKVKTFSWKKKSKKKKNGTHWQNERKTKSETNCPMNAATAQVHMWSELNRKLDRPLASIILQK